MRIFLVGRSWDRRHALADTLIQSAPGTKADHMVEEAGQRVGPHPAQAGCSGEALRQKEKRRVNVETNPPFVWVNLLPHYGRRYVHPARCLFMISTTPESM